MTFDQGSSEKVQALADWDKSWNVIDTSNGIFRGREVELVQTYLEGLENQAQEAAKVKVDGTAALLAEDVKDESMKIAGAEEEVKVAGDSCSVDGADSPSSECAIL